uniref:Uncharacterized protein n=1 Tax=Tanacetum cinerariifolium TaxID=118510 RepID=A0A6L2K0X0_TANCI|nr:hypothetical protein [Tanacetum cinerariifolium]
MILKYSLINSNWAPTSMNWSSSTGMVAVEVAIGEAIGDGTVSDIMGDGMGEGTIEGVEETRNEPDDHSGDGGVRAYGVAVSLPNKDPYLSFHITFAMSTQQDIYAAGSENRPHMLNKENYVPWSSRLLRYAKSRPNRKLFHNSIINGPYVKRMIPEPGDINREVPVNETFHVQTYDELTEKELKQIEADDQAIQTILLGLTKDIYAAVDSCETAQEIWLRVHK